MEIINTIQQYVKDLTQEQKEKLGIELLSLGVNLYFTKDGDIRHNNIVLKNAINHNTLIGSFADSGGYIHGDISPMNQYDTQSVINILRHKLLLKHTDATSSTDVINEYKDKWKY